MHLPQGTIRPPQAAALTVKIGSKAGGTEGRERLCTWTHPRPFSAPFPLRLRQAGPPSFPRMSALRCFSSSVRQGILCCEIGGKGAWQPSLRSGRLRRPVRAEQDNSRRRTSLPSVPNTGQKGWKMAARRYCVIPPIGGVPLLWWTLISVHVAEEHRLTRIKPYAWQGRRGRRTVCLHSCGVPVVSLLLGQVLRSSHYFHPSRNLPPCST